MTVPESRTTIALTTDDLRKLPPGAKFTNKNGQASAQVTAKGDTIYITAICDSLQTLLYEYERQLDSLRVASKEVVTETKIETGFIFDLRSFAIGVVSVLILLLINSLIKKFK